MSFSYTLLRKFQKFHIFIKRKSGKVRNKPYRLGYTVCFATQPCLHFIALFANHVDYFVHVLLADIMVRCFHHDTDHRLGAGFTHQNTACITQCFCHFLYGFLHNRVILCCLLIRHADMDVHHIVFSKCTIKCRKCGGADCSKSARCQVLDNFFHK